MRRFKIYGLIVADIATEETSVAAAWRVIAYRNCLRLNGTPTQDMTSEARTLRSALHASLRASGLAGADDINAVDLVAEPLLQDLSRAVVMMRQDVVHTLSGHLETIFVHSQTGLDRCTMSIALQGDLDCSVVLCTMGLGLRRARLRDGVLESKVLLLPQVACESVIGELGSAADVDV